MTHPAVQIRRLRESDLSQVVSLSNQVGWNQVQRDWKAWLDLPEAQCWVVATRRRRVVGTCSAVDYEGRFGWIGMVIVHPEMRRKGIATDLLNIAIAHLESAGCGCQRLDATHFGIDLYRNLGFRSEYEVERWTRVPGPCARPVGDAVLTLDGAVPAALQELDREAFGASRASLLRWFLEGSEGAYIGDGDLAKGFALHRPGHNAHQIGPIVSGDAASAGALLAHLISRLSDGPIIMDIAAQNDASSLMLKSQGFERSRSLTRMCRGRLPGGGNQSLIYSLAGFEWG